MSASIPTHLSRQPWYPGHLAYLEGAGLKPRHDPGSAIPERANLRGEFLAKALAG